MPSYLPLCRQRSPSRAEGRRAAIAQSPPILKQRCGASDRMSTTQDSDMRLRRLRKPKGCSTVAASPSGGRPRIREPRVIK